MGLGDLLGKTWDKAKDITGDTIDTAGLVLDTIGADDAVDFAWGAIKPGLEGLETAYRYGVSRPISTVALLEGNNPVDWSEWGQAWDRSEDISPGQALFNNVATQADRVPGLDAGTAAMQIPILGAYLNQGDSVNKAADPNFDITDPAQRGQLFSGGGAQLFSGSTDAALRWYADPLVPAGKGASLLRRALITKPITGVTNLDRAAESRGVADVIDALSTRTPAERTEWLARSPIFKNKPELNQLLSTTESADEMKALLRVWMDGSPANIAHLGSIRKAKENELLHLRDTRIPMLERALDDTLENLPTAATPREAYYAQRRAERTAAAIEKANADLAVTSEAAAVARMMHEPKGGRLANVPRITLGQRLETRANWTVFQPSRYNPATRILKSAGTLRTGYIDFDRPGMATEQVKRMLDRVGHGFGGTRVGPVRIGGIAEGGLDRATKGAILAKVNAAHAQGPQAIRDAVEEAEAIAFNFYAKRAGIHPDVARELVRQTQTARNVIVATVRGKGKNPAAFSGAPKLDANGRPIPGKFLDEIEDGVGVKREPVMLSQADSGMPVLDVDALAKVISRHRAHELGDEDWKHILARLKGAPVTGQISVLGEEFLRNINRYWKPAQLFRLGWPIRVVTDENFRIMSVLGVMTHLELAGHSAGNSVRNGKLGARVRNGATAISRARARGELARLDPAIEHKGIVDQLAGVEIQLGELNAAMQTQTAAMRKAIDANQGTRIYLNSRGVGSKAKMGPRGVTYTTVPGEGAKVRMAMDLADERVYVPHSMAQDPGMAALEDFVPRDELAELYEFTNDELRAIIVTADPSLAGKLSRYNTKNDLLSVYGTTLARNNGHTAIYHTRGEAPTFTALVDDAARDIDSSLFSAATEIQKLRAQIEDLTAARAALSGRAAELPPWTEEIQEAYELAKAQATKPSDLQRGDPRRPRKFTGQVPITIGGRTEFFDDSFEGELGQIFLDLSSSATSTQTMINSGDVYLSALRAKHGQPVNLLPDGHLDLIGDKAKLYEESYFSAWENAVNRQIGSDALARKLLNGEDEDAVAAWLVNDTAGREYRRRLGEVTGMGKDPEQIVGEIAQQVDHYLPTVELKAAALQGNADRKMLTDTIPEVTERPTVHGDSLDAVLGQGAFTRTVDKAISTIYAKLGTAPTDVLSRAPFFTGVYRKSLERQLSFFTDEDVLTREMREYMQRQAREEALTRTRDVLYDLANTSNLADTLRFLSPFYAAWQDALTTWSKLWVEDPSRLARMMQVWEAPTKTGQVYSDEYGNEYYASPLPSWLEKALPGDVQLDMPKNWMRDLIFQGDYWYSPGAGAPVTIPTAALVRERPDLGPLLKPILPYGAGEDMWDQVLPAGWRNAATTWSKEDDADYTKTFVQASFMLEAENRAAARNGGVVLGQKELYAEAKRRANDFWRVRTAASFLLPFSPRIKTPWTFYVDKAREYQTRYAAMPGGKDPGGKDWQEAFLAELGEDFYAFTEGTTVSNVPGLAPTVGGFNAFNKYKDLIQANPEYAGLIVGGEGGYGSGEFNNDVYNYQLGNIIGGGDNRTLRENVDPKTAIAEAQVSAGWDEYRRIDKLVDNAMISRGLTSLNSTAAADLAEFKRAAKEKIAEKYPSWADAFNSFDVGKADKLVEFLEGAVNDPRLADRPGWRSITNYLALRKLWVAALDKRESSNLQAKSNTDLRDAWDGVVTKLKEADPAFSDIWLRYLSNDKMTGAAL